MAINDRLFNLQKRDRNRVQIHNMIYCYSYRPTLMKKIIGVAKEKSHMQAGVQLGMLKEQPWASRQGC